MTTHTVTLVFEDGRSVAVPADEDDTVYLAALKKRIRIETDCREGACATCKGICTQGEYAHKEYSDEALTDEEAARGEVLTCQMQVRSDCVIEFPYDSAIAMKAGPETRPATVAEVEKISSAVYRLVVEPEGDTPVAFLPGQYVHLAVPGTSEHRSYSFANPPEVADKLTFYIKVLEQGVMSEYISTRAQSGDEIPVTGPFGHFYLRPPVRPLVMVAGGTGLAPMLSMLDHLVNAGGTDQPIHLLYGANTPDELFGLDQLAGYAAQGLTLTTETCVVEGGEGWSGATGHITDLLRAEMLDGGDIDAYLCGPPPMIDAGTGWLSDNGVEMRRIHAEKFLPS